MADLERELDRLYGLPPDQFTAARNELAKQLREEGDRDAAEQVRALPKPTIAAWAVNQLARGRQAGVSELLDAAAALRSAQRRALSGGEGGDAVRRAAAHRAEAVRTLAAAAWELLDEAGLKATDSTIERVATTLAAASIDEEGRRLLARGRIATDQSPTGFEAVGGLPAAPTRRAPRTDAAKKRASAAEQKRRLRELESTLRRLEREAQASEREAERAEREAEKAKERATAARASADEAAARAEAASRELEEAQGNA